MTPPDDGMVLYRNLQQEPILDRLYRQQFRILYTMFETDQLPRGWAERINIGTDMVMVPSKFLIETFERSGVQVPVVHTPTGIDTQLYRPGPRQLARHRGQPQDKQIRVLLCGTLTRRKNVAGAVTAFQLAAGDDPNWQLLVKTQPNHPEFDEFVKRPIDEAHDSRIKLITERYTREQMIALYHLSDLFVWPSFGEGIGLPPQEAMSCGLEVVAGAHSGALDFLSERVAYPVEADKVPALEFKSMHAGEDWGNVGNWWAPRLETMAKQLQLAAAATGKIARGPKARDFIARERHQQVTARSILNAIQQHVLPRLS
jgi:glycosyltransferase involved in cell wall biosynthesis